MIRPGANGLAEITGRGIENDQTEKIIHQRSHVTVGERINQDFLFAFQDLLLVDSMKLDWIFRFSLVNDIIAGMSHLHSTELNFHGRLTSGCCYIDGKFVLKIGDFGLPTFYTHFMPKDKTNEDFKGMYWLAPELLTDYETDMVMGASQAGDVYAFAIILAEIISREEPYSTYMFEPNGTKE